jgi:hypothetical protein
MAIGRYYVVGMLVVGLIAGFVIAAAPRLREVPASALIGPLVVSFVIDLALMPLAREGRVRPLSMEQRAVGVIGAALIATLIMNLMPA